MKAKKVLSVLLALCMLLSMVTVSGVAVSAEASGLTVDSLRADMVVNPIGIDNTAPSLSWKLHSAERGVVQASYRIMASSSAEALAAGNYDLWDSGEIAEDTSAGVNYAGEELTSGERVYWKVEVKDNYGNTAVSTEEAYFEMGLLNDSDWQAKWIELDASEESGTNKYSIEMDFRIDKDDAGIIFAGKDTNNFLMWQINTFEKKWNGVTSFRPHQWVGGNAQCIDEFSIDDIIPVSAQHDWHHIKIDVDGKVITTYIDETQVDQRESEYAQFGKIGFRQSTAAGDCDEQATYDNIFIYDENGEVIFQDDFSNGNDNFGFGEVRDGALFVQQTLALQKELPGEEPEESSVKQYVIDYDFKIDNMSSGFVFAAKDTSNFLMWQVNTAEAGLGGVTYLRPHKWVENTASCIKEINIGEIIPVDQQKEWHHMTIQVDTETKTITTLINDVEVESAVYEENLNFGKIGFRLNGNEASYYDNIVVQDGEGNILFSDEFSAPINTNFDVGSVKDGAYYVVGQLGLQIDQGEVEGAPMYRKEFDVNKEVKKATIYASSLGIYELELNGQKVSDDLFNPGWTQYEYSNGGYNYVMYQTFDVTDMVQQGENVLGAMTGHGWYSGKLFIHGYNNYGDTGSKLLCQMEVEYTDGSKDIIATDTSWKVTDKGPITFDDFQGGETYDARRELTGWSEPGYDDSEWTSPVEFTYDGDVIAHIGPKVKVVQEFKPVSIEKLDNDTYIVDFGQNIAGFIRLNVTGEEGTIVRLRHGEMLQADGSLYTANLRSAKATDYYTLKGDPNGETYQPRFTFHGFQYAEVVGYPGELTEDDITGIAISSLQDQTGTFETSDELVNQLQSNIHWGQLDNFISVPTDCPQRDERLGYNGDGQVFIRTATMNMDVASFFKKFMKDTLTSQKPNGAVADWNPTYGPNGGSYDQTGWGDAIIIMPWTLYTAYGDETYITDNYEGMKKYIQYYLDHGNGGYIVSVGTNGDWLNVNSPTPQNVISTSYFAYCSDLLSRMAEVIGETEDAAYYRDLFEKIRAAFNEEFVDEEGHVSGETQTAYLLALKYDLLPTEELREKAAAHLVEDIKEHDWHLTTGFLGVGLLCPVLSDMGYSDVAYRLLLQETYPGWLYSVVNGATTIWERWNSYIAETGTFGDVGMNSFNHYSYGAIGEWFYNYVGGIRYDEDQPGYKHVIVDPDPSGKLDYANTSFESVYGTIVSNWKYNEENMLEMDVTVPANATATISVPASSVDEVLESGIPATEAKGLSFVGMEDGKAVFEAGSGSYSFTTDTKRKFTVNIEGDGESDSYITINGSEPMKTPVSEEFYAGEELTVTATPVNDVDYTFNKWSGDAQSNESTMKLTVEGAMDLKVENTMSDRVNLALEKSVSSSSTINNTDWNQKYLTDGNLISKSGSNGFTTNSTNSDLVNHWVEIDLGENMDLNRIQIYPRTDVFTEDGTSPSFPRDFEIQVRRDGESEYTTVASFTDYEAPYLKPAVIEFDTTNARYVRLSVSRVGDPPAGEPYYLQLAEMGVYNVSAVEPPVSESVTAPGEATANELFTVTAVTGDDVANVALFNENGLKLGLKEMACTDNGDGTLTWTFQTAIGTVGKGRTLTLATIDAEGVYTLTEASFTMDVKAVQPEIMSAEMEEEAVVNEPVILKVVTSKDVQKIEVENENGLKMGTLSQKYEDTEEGREWTIEMKIGTQGTRSFLVRGKNVYGDVTSTLETNPVTVTSK